MIEQLLTKWFDTELVKPGLRERIERDKALTAAFASEEGEPLFEVTEGDLMRFLLRVGTGADAALRSRTREVALGPLGPPDRHSTLGSRWHETEARRAIEAIRGLTPLLDSDSILRLREHDAEARRAIETSFRSSGTTDRAMSSR